MPSNKDRYEATFVVGPDPQTTDFQDIQQAINNLPSAGGKIFVRAGTYTITKTLSITTSNVQIQGEGMGITNIVLDQPTIGKPALEVFNSAVGTARSLVADTARGDRTLKLSPANAATLSQGDTILLYSDKSIDSEEPAKHAGEVKQVISVDPVSGVVRVDDQIYDAYLLADSAKVIRITMLRNIALSDFSITTTAQQATLKLGFTDFRFIDNLQVERVESHHAYNSGIALHSVLNSRIADCYIHDIHDVTPPSNVHYGIVVGSASQNISINGCRFAHTRHAVTTGGSSGTNLNGMPRNVTIANCTSMAADTAHFDTHEPAENVTYIGCSAIGGVPAKDVVVGFQMRGRNSSIIGCSVLQAVGKGIMIFGKVSSGATITGNMIANVKAIAGAAGIGIHLDSNGTSQHTITGNTIKNCEGSAIRGEKTNNDVVVSGNLIVNSNSVVTGASISFKDAARATIAGNQIMNNATGKAIEMAGSSDGWYIAGNYLFNNSDNRPVLVGVQSVVINNPGYNPVGQIPNPWPASGGDLTNNVVGGSANPHSGTVYTVRHSPKTIVVKGGTVSKILIDGTETGLKAGVFKLAIGETIVITFSVAPTTAIAAD